MRFENRTQVWTTQNAKQFTPHAIFGKCSVGDKSKTSEKLGKVKSSAFDGRTHAHGTHADGHASARKRTHPRAHTHGRGSANARTRTSAGAHAHARMRTHTREGPPPDAQPRPREGGGSQRAPGAIHSARIHLKWLCRLPHRRRSVASLALDARRFIAYSAKPS